ncbi:MAG TPA: DUF4398 domain-containing protein [Syntrophorhabdaceae bacterium]|nr:DUF4398 domain-containing protein [Syntrophorhabdaceae bacterium]
MKHLEYAVLLLVVLSFAFMFTGCATPPDAEKTAAKASYDAAATAGADKYAANDFGAAKSLWDKAESLLNEKKYKEAKQVYIDAKTAFEKAKAAVEAGKKAVVDEVNAVVSSLEESWKSLEETAKKMEKSLKGKKDEWSADAKAIEEGLKATKDMIASDPIGAKVKSTELKTMIDKWDTAFKELPAPAKTPAPKKK